MRAVGDRCDQPAGEIGAVGTIAVEEHNDVAGGIGRCGAGSAGAAIATFGQRDHARAGGTGNVRRAVAAGAIGDDDLVHDIARQLSDDASDGGGFVQRGDDGATSRPRSGRGRSVTDSIAARNSDTAWVAHR